MVKLTLVCLGLITFAIAISSEKQYPRCKSCRGRNLQSSLLKAELPRERISYKEEKLVVNISEQQEKGYSSKDPKKKVSCLDIS